MMDLSFSKVTNLQCSDCNLTLKTAYRRFFLEYVLKTSGLKKYFIRNKVYDGQVP